MNEYDGFRTSFEVEYTAKLRFAAGGSGMVLVGWGSQAVWLQLLCTKCQAKGLCKRLCASFGEG